jgi:hypothetical protein
MTNAMIPINARNPVTTNPIAIPVGAEVWGCVSCANVGAVMVGRIDELGTVVRGNDLAVVVICAAIEVMVLALCATTASSNRRIIEKGFGSPDELIDANQSFKSSPHWKTPRCAMPCLRTTWVV